MPPAISRARRIRQTPFTPRVDAAGVQSYSVYNHMLLPSSFRGPEADYHHLKSHVQVWDVACERQVELVGPDAGRLVQLMTPRDVSRAVVGQCVYLPVVDSAGGMLNDPVGLKLAEDRWWLSLADSDLLLYAEGLARGLGLDVRCFEPDVSPLAIQGPKADELARRVFGEGVPALRFFRFDRFDFEGHPLLIARSGWSKQGGFEIYLDDSALGLALWDRLMAAGEDLEVGPGCPNLIERIEGGLLSYGNDMTRDNDPLECGLERYCHLDRDTGCLGLEALRKVAAEGPARKIRGLKIAAERLPPCIQPWALTAGGKAVGQVTSAAVSPRFGAIAFAMVERGWWDPGTAVTVETPAGEAAGEVCEMPFG